MNIITRAGLFLAIAAGAVSASAALEPVSITPDGGTLKVGTDIQIKFDENIGWTDWYDYDDNDIQLISLDPDNGGELYMAFDGSTYISGSILHVKFISDSFLAGVKDWRLYIPAGTLEGRSSGETNNLITVDYIESMEITISFADPAYDAEEIEAFHQPLQVKVDPSDAVYTGKAPTDDEAEIDAKGRMVWKGTDDSTATYPVFFTEGEEAGTWNMIVYLMSVNESTPGSYELTIDAGAFKSGNTSSAEFKHNWTIAETSQETGDEDIEPMAILPYDEEQEAPFTSIQIAFPFDDGAVEYDENVGKITFVKDATEEEMAIEVATNNNMVKISMDLEINGGYTLTVPAGALRNKKGKNVEIVRHYTVINGESEDSGINSVETEGKNAEYYNLKGQKLANPASGEVVIRVTDEKRSKIRF